MLTLSDLTTSINRDGLRKVAVAESDAANEEELSQALSQPGQNDKRMTNGLDHDRPVADDVERFKISNSSLTPPGESQAQSRSLNDQVFGRAEALRGSWEHGDAIEESNLAARDRFASGGGMTIIKYVSHYHV